MSDVRDLQTACANVLVQSELTLSAARAGAFDLRMEFRRFLSDLPQQGSTPEQHKVAAQRYQALKSDFYFQSWAIRKIHAHAPDEQQVMLRRIDRNLDRAYRKLGSQYGCWVQRHVKNLNGETAATPTPRVRCDDGDPERPGEG